MTRHIFTLVWNRKRSTMLIMIEILICFLVLCFVLSSGLQLARLWLEPLGYEWRDAWVVRIDGANFLAASPEELDATREGLRELLAESKRVDGVESAALAANVPYSSSSWMTTVWIDGRKDDMYITPVTTGYHDVMGLRTVYGRWLEDGDLALSYTPVVITRNLARDLFGDEDALGRIVPEFERNGEVKEPEDASEVQRVVGVIENVKRRGELEPTPYMSFALADLQKEDFLPTQFALRTAPGVAPDFEERYIRALQRVAPQWTYTLSSLEQLRERQIRKRLSPLLIAAVVAAFLIVMVGLGLVGVLWQSVTRRTAELGVRRALGASADAVRRQVLGELWALTTLAVVVGTVLFLQIPFIGANLDLGWLVLLGGTLLAAMVLFAIVTVCGLYPTWLATRVQPAEALQYE